MNQDNHKELTMDELAARYKEHHPDWTSDKCRVEAVKLLKYLADQKGSLKHD